MAERTETWPVGLRRLAEVIGPKAAVDLAEALGGIEHLYIPQRARIDHAVTAIVGLDRMEALCAAFGSRRIEIPRGVYRDLAKARIIDAVGSTRAVALRCGVTQRYVRRVRAQLRDARQPDLFDAPAARRPRGGTVPS